MLLYLFVVVGQVAQGFYAARGIEPPPGYTLTYALGFIWMIGRWMLRDSRERGISLVYDQGMFLYIVWPIIMPYYLIKTRGSKGLRVIFAFVVAYIGALVIGIILGLLTNAS